MTGKIVKVIVGLIPWKNVMKSLRFYEIYIVFIEGITILLELLNQKL